MKSNQGTGIPGEAALSGKYGRGSRQLSIIGAETHKTEKCRVPGRLWSADSALGFDVTGSETKGPAFAEPCLLKLQLEK
jgi:hypothetical protein